MRYHSGLRIPADREPGYRLIGTLFHAGAAEHHAKVCQPRPWWAGQKTPEERVRELGIGRPVETRTALEMLDYYVNFVDQQRGWGVFLVEREFRASLGQLHELYGKSCPADVRDEIVTARPDLGVVVNGNYFCLDHKTVGTQWGGRGTTTLAAWNNEQMLAEHGWQMTIMSMIVRAELPHVQPHVMIQRVKREIPFAVQPDILFVPQPMFEDVIDSLVESVRREREVFSRMELGEKPAGNFKACQGRYGKCDFFQACHAETRQDRLYILQNDYRRIT